MNGPTHPFPPRRSSFLLVLSNKSANCTVYYDDGTFSVRVSGAYREGYRTSTSGNANIFEGFASSFNLDAAIRYQLNEHIELSLDRSEEHTSELQSLMRISYAVFCLKKKKNNKTREKSIHESQTSQDRLLTHKD